MSPKGRRRPSRQSETPKSGKPVTEKVLAAMVRRGTIPKSSVAKTRFSISGAASNLQHLTAKIGWLLWPLRGISQATRYGVLVREGPARKKNLVQQTIASRWWCVVTVRSLQTISRYAALWFWDLVCSAAVRSLHVLGRSPVCRSFC